ncbi:MAG: DUF4369 domain-containing protein [Prevotella sp.]
MKKTIGLILAALVLFPVASMAQYTILGQVKGLNDGKVYLQIGGKSIDSTMVEKGRFLFVGGKTDIHFCAVVSADRKWGCGFYLDNSDIKILSNDNGGVDIVGSKEEDLFLAYTEHMKSIRDEMIEVSRKTDKALLTGDMALIDSLSAYKENVLKHREDSVFLEFADRNPSAFICFNHVYNTRVVDKYNFSRYNALLKHLTPGAFSGEQWDTFMHIYKIDESLEPGHPFPEIAMNDVYGVEHKISDYRGKYLFVMIATDGVKGYQVKDVDFRKSLYDKYHSKGYDEMDIMIVQTAKDIIKTGATHNMPWTLVSDLKYWDSPLRNTLGLDYICQNYLIDPNGVIVGHNLTDKELVEKLEKVF